MANSKSQTIVIRGTLDWAKVLGKPRFNEYSGQNEWSVDVTPNEDSRKAIAKAGISDKLRTPKANDTRKESFISFRHRELTKDGDKNDPIRIVNASGETWPESKLLGNGTTADVKFQVKDYGKGVRGTYIRAIRVLDHVPFVSQEFAPLSEDDEFFASDEGEGLSVTEAENTEDRSDLDDDIPF